MRHRMLVPLQLLVRDSPPQGMPATGDVYFNTEQKSIQVYDGTQWGGVKGAGGDDEILITPTTPAAESIELWVDTGVAGGDVVSPDSGAYVTTIGNGTDTTIRITHNLGTKDILLSLWLTSNGKLTTTEITSIDDNSVSLTFPTAPGRGAVRAVIASAASRGGGIDRNYVDRRIWQGTEAEYNAITTKKPDTIYIVTANTGTKIHINGGTALHTEGPVVITDDRLQITGPDGGIDVTQGRGVTVLNAPVLIRSTTSAGKFTSDGGSFEVIHKPQSNPGTQVGFWRKTGNTVGPLIADQPHEPITKAYLDQNPSTGGGLDQTTADALYVDVTGDTMSGPLVVDYQSDNGPSIRASGEVHGGVFKSGYVDPVTGWVPSEPFQPEDLTPKSYVDNLVGAGGGGSGVLVVPSLAAIPAGTPSGTVVVVAASAPPPVVPPSRTPTIVSYTKSATSSGTFSIDRPQAVQSGDLLLFLIGSQTDSLTGFIQPTGFVDAGWAPQIPATSTLRFSYASYKFVTDSASEPQAYQFQTVNSANARSVSHMLVIRGAATPPISAWAGPASRIPNNQTAIPSVSVLTDGSLAIGHIHTVSTTVSAGENNLHSVPTGWSLQDSTDHPAGAALTASTDRCSVYSRTVNAGSLQASPVQVGGGTNVSADAGFVLVLGPK